MYCHNFNIMFSRKGLNLGYQTHTTGRCRPAPVVGLFVANNVDPAVQQLPHLI
jgi:hypothetical protein